MHRHHRVSVVSVSGPHKASRFAVASIVVATVLAAGIGWRSGVSTKTIGLTRLPASVEMGVARSRTLLTKERFDVYETDRPRVVWIDAEPQRDLTPPLADLDVWDPSLADRILDGTGAPIRLQWYPSDAAAEAAQARYEKEPFAGQYVATRRQEAILALGWVLGPAQLGRLRQRLGVVLAAPSEPR